MGTLFFINRWPIFLRSGQRPHGENASKVVDLSCGPGGSRVLEIIMKITLSLVAAILATACASAQTPPGANSTFVASPETNRLGLGDLSFTNRAGTVFSADQLAAQLQNLRSAVDQTLPVLTAFNETFSNANGSSSTLSGTLSGLLSGALNRYAQNTNASGQTSSQLTNLLAGAQRLLSTNSTGSASVNANTLRDLVSLQGQLQPVESTLQSLNVSVTNSLSVPTDRLSPTGR